MLAAYLRSARAHLALIRARDLLDMVFLVLLGGYATSDAFAPGMHAVGAIGALSFAVFYANIVNDIDDLEVDRVNRPERPLVTGAISVPEARALARYYAVLALVLGALSGIAALVAAGVLLLMGFLYSHRNLRLSHRGLLGTANIVLGYFVVPFGLGIALAGGILPGTDAALLFGAVACLGVARLLLKDFRDREGDARLGKRTPLVSHGSARIAFAVAGIAGAGLGFWTATALRLSAGPAQAILLGCGVALAALLLGSVMTRGSRPVVIATYVAMRLSLGALVLVLALG